MLSGDVAELGSVAVGVVVLIRIGPPMLDQLPAIAAETQTDQS